MSGWINSSNKIIAELSKQVNEDITNSIDSFVATPINIIESNVALINDDIVDLHNEDERNKFFVSVLNSQDSYIYSFSYGTENGEYYGARRTPEGIIQIMENNALTNNESWYYSVNDDYTKGELVLKAGAFDPRTRDWYKVAKNSNKLSFSPLYKHFIMDDLAISVSAPFYDENDNFYGVLGVHTIISNLDNYLVQSTQKSGDDSFAFVIENGTYDLVSNSLGVSNYNIDGNNVERISISSSDSSVMALIGEKYIESNLNEFQIDDGNYSYNVSVANYNYEGISWLIITSISRNDLMADIYDNLRLSIISFVLIIAAVIVGVWFVIHWILKPVVDLAKAEEDFSKGNMKSRVKTNKNDEIGLLAKSFNQMAETIDELVNQLEGKISERTSELKAKKEELQLILDSTAEAIYGVDLGNNCNFCNASFLKMLRYNSEEEVLGKNIHYLIHYKDIEGNPLDDENCRLSVALKKGELIEDATNVFYKSDGEPIQVIYSSHPQYIDNKIVGAVVVFKDASEIIENERKIKYASRHDYLTGLYNRSYIDIVSSKYDNAENWPISVIFVDINGLKLTNDIFGHVAGDELIRKSAAVLKKSCRQSDVIARIGGDEFLIFLFNTSEKDAQVIVDRIKSSISKEKVEAVKCSLSIGYGVKNEDSQKLEHIILKAEHEMYKDKTINHKNSSKAMLETIISTLHERSPKEKSHSLRVSDISLKIGKKIGLSRAQLVKLKDSAFYHDIGKIVLPVELLNEYDELTPNQKKQMEQHVLAGYRILNLFDQTIDLADNVYYHHECWGGSGYPKGLKKEEIPLISRIITVAEYYDRKVNNVNNVDLNKKDIIADIKSLSGIKFDPNIVEAFISIMK